MYCMHNDVKPLLLGVRAHDESALPVYAIMLMFTMSRPHRIYPSYASIHRILLVSVSIVSHLCLPALYIVFTCGLWLAHRVYIPLPLCLECSSLLLFSKATCPIFSCECRLVRRTRDHFV